MNKHNEHYKHKFIEAIDVQEQIILNGIPNLKYVNNGIDLNLHDVILQNFRAATAAKYLIRLNLKDEPINELDKAENYIFRSKTGKWKE